MSLNARLSRLSGQPLHVILFRAAQYAKQLAMHRLGLWRRVSLRAERFLCSSAGRQMREHYEMGKARLVVVSPSAMRAIRQLESPAGPRDKILGLADAALARQFSIFGVPVPENGPWPWARDWRFDKAWAPKPYWQHDFYEPRTEPYDAKFPWELSRLAMVLHLLQGQAIADSDEYGSFALEILRDWRSSNPVAWSIGWTPMEASVRTISLVQFLELTTVVPFADKDLRRGLIDEILLLLYCHGVFVWNHIEYSDVRGNHYTANIVALLLVGAVFGPYTRIGRQWLAYGRGRFSKEVGLQYFGDGINFEASVAYHRLVTELFMLGYLALERLASPVDSVTRSVLRKACNYAAACRRPDGLAVNAGDSDDATVLCFDGAAPRDHSALISLGACHFDDDNLRAAVSCDSLAVVWLLGRSIAQSGRASIGTTAKKQYFPRGGVVVWQQSRDYIWIDVGHVGMKGRGGHGHNDLFSFELVLDGAPVVIDPGTYYYTGDLSARDWFRSTAAHNSLQVGDAELGELSGPWRIANSAEPFDVAISEHAGRHRVTGSHSGYHRTADPVEVTRVFDWGGSPWSLLITDKLFCRHSQKTKRRLHLSLGANVSVHEHLASLAIGPNTYAVTWSEATRAGIEQGYVSDRYGHRAEAPVLLLEQTVHHGESVFVKISKT